MTGEINANKFMLTIYDVLDELFGKGKHLFCLEMPGQNINYLDYSYNLTDSYSSTLKKPHIIQDNEFRLSENMFHPSPFIQGPTGEHFSNVYSEVINNYLPNFDGLQSFFSDKMRIREFLLKNIETTVDNEKIKCSRIEFCQKMYEKYLDEKINWENEKYENYNSSQNLEEYGRWLSKVASKKDYELSKLFDDSIVKGYYHEVMTVLGFLDVSSLSERLYNAKMSLHNSSRKSLDGSRNVLPVSLQPSDWAQCLKPNFKMEDLTNDYDALKKNIKNKKKTLIDLETQLEYLIKNNITTAEQLEKQMKLDKVREQVRTNEIEQTRIYGDILVDAAKIAIDYYSGGKTSALQGIDPSKIINNSGNINLNSAAKSANLNEDSLTKLIKNVVNVYVKQIEYDDLMNDLISAMRDNAAAMVRNNYFEITSLNGIVNKIKEDINELVSILFTKSNNENIETFPSSKYNNDAYFTEVVISKEDFSQKSKIEEKSSASMFKARTFGASVSYSKESATNKFYQEIDSKEFTLGMRAMKVLFDRGDWFDKSIINSSNSFKRIQGNLYGGAGLTVDDVKGNFANNRSMYDHKYALPAYPMGFLIVKDITITIYDASSMTDICKEFTKSQTSGSAGLFFSKVSYNNESMTYMNTFSSKDNKTTITLKIPGPLILGWFLELPSKDESQVHTRIPEDSLEIDKMIDKIIENECETKKDPCEKFDTEKKPDPCEEKKKKKKQSIIEDNAPDNNQNQTQTPTFGQ